MFFFVLCFSFARLSHYYSHYWIPRNSEMCQNKIWIAIPGMMNISSRSCYAFASFGHSIGLIESNVYPDKLFTRRRRRIRRKIQSKMYFASMQFYAKFQATKSIRWMTFNCIASGIFRLSLVCVCACNVNKIPWNMFTSNRSWLEWVAPGASGTHVWRQ